MVGVVAGVGEKEGFRGMADRMTAEEAAGAGWGEGTQRCRRPRATEAGGWASGWWEVHVRGASLLLVLSR